MKIDVTQKADIRAVLGAPGTGKSHYLKAVLAKEKRALVWDMEDEYVDIPAVTIQMLPAALHMAGKGAFKFRVIPTTDADKRQIEFDLFCRTAMAVGNLLMLAEELRFVTQPSKAPAGWASVTLRGRKRGVRVVGASQRPASIDKDFLGGATLIRCGALGYPEDRKAVAAVMGIDPGEIEKLEGFQSITWTRTPRSVKRT
jgi:hypothetical protein